MSNSETPQSDAPEGQAAGKAPQSLTRTQRRTAVALLVLFGVLGVMILGFACNGAAETLRITGEYVPVSARVVGGEWVTHSHAGRHGSHTTTAWHPKYVYTVEGRSYEGLQSTSADPEKVKTGDALEVRYNPRHPAESTASSDVQLWLGAAVVIAMGLAFVGISFFGLRYFLKTRPKA